MPQQPPLSWKFLNPAGDFRLKNPHHTSYLYFPLVNAAGLMSVVTPTLHGDVKTGQHAFLTPPVSVEDLHTSRTARNFWATFGPADAWSATGNSARQTVADSDEVTLEAGFLWHKITRQNPGVGLRADVLNFIPAGNDAVELMSVTLTNISRAALTFIPTAAIPLYGRSADNVRDHRHVTALLHRIRCVEHGVLVTPTLSFDERGHQPNAVTYGVLGVDGEAAPLGFFPLLADFTGEGRTLDWPRAATDPLAEWQPAGFTAAGYEALGGLRFRQVTLAPGESRQYVLLLAVFTASASPEKLLAAYGSPVRFAAALRQTQEYWHSHLNTLAFESGDTQFDGWLQWVALQPTLRRLFGNSFLPYHDYGRGGRGWRDLWQDILALLLMESGPVDELLFGNFAGVRLDGSNATIIGSLPGEFKADRNNLPRVWMDHGAWPWLTTRLYLDQTGDLAFLLRPQAYFKDQHTHRAQALDADWNAAQGTQQRAANGSVYTGSVLEHLLVQHLTAFFNVGAHNNLRLEGADWNDGLDMARRGGESVAFSALYAANLRQLAGAVRSLAALGETHVSLAAELLLLLDTLGEPLDYASPAAKQARLGQYFDRVHHTVSGENIRVPLATLAADLQAKADWLAGHIRRNEWLESAPGEGWFNGYYDDDGNRLEGATPQGARMTLTGQVFPLMGGVADDAQAQAVLRAADRYLFDARVGGYRLNTDFDAVLLNMGRCFGFAFGHKENGAMFSHMAVMYAYALYQRGFARPAWRVLATLYRHSTDFAASRMYPGIPEYFDARGRGVYPYLTGSASWYLLTLVTQSFGVRGANGDLLLAPQLVGEQFCAGQAALTTLFAGRRLQVIYRNSDGLDAGSYRVERMTLDGAPLDGLPRAEGVCIPREQIAALKPESLHTLEILLGPK